MQAFLVKNKKTVANLAFLLLLFLALALVHFLVPPSSMWFPVLRKVFVFSLAAVSMNLLNGFTGLFSLGQAGFMLLGAYTYAVLTIPSEFRDSVFRNYGKSVFSGALPFIIALLLAGVVAAVFAYLIGLPVLKLKSDYLAIATLGFAEIARTVIQSQDLGPITNGPDPVNKFFTLSGILPYAIIASICILIIVLLINSTYGRALKAIRDDEVAAEAMGINLAHHKRISFTVSSFFAGIAGAMLAMCNTVANATAYTTTMTYEILLVVVIGGIGSVTGSVLAAFLFYGSSEWWLRFLDDGSLSLFGKELHLPAAVFKPGFRMVVFSVIIMLVVLFFRRGIMGAKELDVLATLGKIRNFFVGLFKKVRNLFTKKGEKA